MPNDASERDTSITPFFTSSSITAAAVAVAPLPLPALTGDSSQVAWAFQIRKQVGQSFDRIAAAVAAGTNRYKSLTPEETSSLLAVVEEHRASVLGMCDARYFMDQWQDPIDRAQRLIHADARWLSMVEARAARNPRPDAVAPIRYMGFDDAKGVRIFKFGRLPANALTPVYKISVPVSLLLAHGISFQDAPSMCAAIMASRDACSCTITEEDCLAFIALRPVKADRKAPRKKAAQPED